MQTPPRGQKVWALPLKTAGPPSRENFSPRKISGGGPDAQEQRKAIRRPAWVEGLRLMRGVLT
nr:MAG TPA: hypothetical protein [Caudoviricetes sp.]DAI94565.1 MAG TPA: hypothetical protein [Caudoviricetes sp.]